MTRLPAKAALPKRYAERVETRFADWLASLSRHCSAETREGDAGEAPQASPANSEAERPTTERASAPTAAPVSAAAVETTEAPSAASQFAPAGPSSVAEAAREARGRATDGRAEPAPAPSPPSPASGLRVLRGPSPKPTRLRDPDHLRFVAGQPCLLCGRAPADPHHLRFAQPRALARKSSDEFVVPLCRLHHDEAHKHGNEAAWWQSLKVDPIAVALDLWRRSRRREVNAKRMPPSGASHIEAAHESEPADVETTPPDNRTGPTGRARKAPKTPRPNKRAHS